MVNIGPLTAENYFPVWGTAANFNGFCILAALLHWRRSAQANHTLHDVWPSPWLVHYIYIFGAFARYKIHFAFKSCALLYWQCCCTALWQWVWAKLCGVVEGMELRNFRRGHHLYSAWRLSHFLGIGPHSSFLCLICLIILICYTRMLSVKVASTTLATFKPTVNFWLAVSHFQFPISVCFSAMASHLNSC